MSKEDKELPSTYVVYQRSPEELQRLMLQDQLITHAMGGVLAGQDNPDRLHRILDIACGPGGWCIAVANQYPKVEVCGIDISHTMITRAKEHAEAQQLSDRVFFEVMDALSALSFPSRYVDLVNLRFGVSFIRMWEWNRVISEMLRVTKEGGVIHITETAIVHNSTSPALTTFQQKCLCALERAGHLPERDPAGMIPHLVPLLNRYGVRQLQSKPHRIEFHAGTDACRIYIEDVTHAMRAIKPFLHKWGCLGDDYEQVCQIAQSEMRCSEFEATWELLALWGVK